MAKDKQGKGDKKNTSLRLDAKTLKALKIRAIEEDTSVQKIIEKLIKNYLDEGKAKKNKI
ncbi:ribbon-helix-helix protein, CopG family [Vibrio sp. HN007]|uniref:ribbon-helix-helix protein, CopG family n=1 Tax=Vibrio iocasae TaxID=3098914 RepID=UPI0035D4086D